MFRAVLPEQSVERTPSLIRKKMWHLLVLSASMVSAVQSQHHVNFETNNNIERNVRLIHHAMALIEPFGMLMCAKECLLHTDCKSWNFERQSLKCELNSKSAYSVPSDKNRAEGWYYSKREAWEHVVKGPCKNHKCQPHTKCLGQKEGGHICVHLGCDLLVNITEEFQSQGFAPVSTHVTHHDTQRNLVFNATCRADGQWNFSETPEEPSCSSDPLLPTPNFLEIYKNDASAAYGCPPGVNGVLRFVCDKKSKQWQHVNGTCHASWCPSDFIYDVVLDQCFKVMKYKAIQIDANANCGSMSPGHSGHLLLIDSQERQTFIQDYLLSLNLNTVTRLWIDGRRDNHHAKLKTSQGLLFLGYNNIDIGSNSQGNCVQLNMVDPDFRWYYTDCNASAWYLCQIDKH